MYEQIKEIAPDLIREEESYIEAIPIPVITALIGAAGAIGSGALGLLSSAQQKKALEKAEKIRLEQAKILAEMERKKAEQLSRAIIVGTGILIGGLVLMVLLKERR